MTVRVDLGSWTYSLFSPSFIDSRLHLMWDQRQSQSWMPTVALARSIIKAAE